MAGPGVAAAAATAAPEHENRNVVKPAPSTSRTAAPSERTPLLSKPGNGTPTVPAAKPATPVPWASVLAICFCRLTEPIALTLIFPFINQAISDFGSVRPQDVGFYSGLLESLFTFAQFCTILQWGRLSDRVGRKPVILFGLAGCSISVFAFGLSRSFTAMVVARVLAGSLNGNIGILKSSMSELTDSTNEARAFSFLPLAWTTGASLGPLIGGTLANPAKRFPKVFGHSTFFKEYKYFLPCLVGGLFPVLGIIVGSLFLKESLPSKVRSGYTPVAASESQEEEAETGGAVGAPTEGSPLDGTKEADSEAIPGIRDIITRRVRRTLVNYAMLAFTSMSIAGILPLFLFTPVHLGGLGFDEAQIGTALSAQAITTASVHLLLFAPIQRRFGTARTFRISAFAYPISCAFFPLTSYIARTEYAGDDAPRTRTWICLAVQLMILSLANICYGCNMLIVNQSAPSARALGTLNGAAQMLASLVRTLALAVAPSLFAVSIDKNLLGGQAIWLFLVCMGCGLCCTAWLVSDEPPAWRNEQKAVVAGHGDEERE